MSAPSNDSPKVPQWVVTYGDMMSLLLTFFIMLVSMSELKDEGRVRSMLDSIREVFGASAGQAGVPGLSPQATSVFDRRASQGIRSQGEIEKSGRRSEGRAGAHRTVDRINHGTLVTLGGPALFERFDATPTEDFKAALDAIAGVLADKPNRLMVRGHASPEPLPPDVELVFGEIRVHDQWDLSFARARAAADYLVAKGIDPRRLVVSAAGDTEPRTLTRDRDAQRLNRRVDVFLLDAYITPPHAAE